MTGTCSSIIKLETFQIYVAAGADWGGGRAGTPFSDPSLKCISFEGKRMNNLIEHLLTLIKQEPQGALIAHLSTMSTSVKS